MDGSDWPKANRQLWGANSEKRTFTDIRCGNRFPRSLLVSDTAEAYIALMSFGAKAPHELDGLSIRCCPTYFKEVAPEAIVSADLIIICSKSDLPQLNTLPALLCSAA